MKSFVTLFFIVITFNLFGQYTNVVIDDNGSPEEPSIMMDPRHPDRLVAGSNINSYYFSDDGGYTWTEGYLISSYGVWGDPCIIVDTAGYFYFFHLSNPYNGNWIDRIVSQKYDFENNVWIEDSYMGLNGVKVQDKEWAVVDSATNTIYVTWTQFDRYNSQNSTDSSVILFSKSTDGGVSWSNPKRINKVAGDCLDDDNTVEGAVPAVGPNGEVYVAWAGPQGIMFDRSTDGGNTWLEEDIFVSDQPGGWAYTIPGISRCNGLPVTCCDLSNSPYKGNIYVNWTDQRNGINDTDVWLAKSTDGGNTWSEPVRVNNDAPGKHQFFSWMTVDGVTGDIYIVFYDRRNYPDDNTDVYLARSTDGGETFENIMISESAFLPTSSVFFGDYTNITAHNGSVRPIWTRLQNGNLSVMTAIIDFSVGINHKETADRAPISLQPNYPNPFAVSTTIAFKLERKEKIRLSVYDIYSREVAVIIPDIVKLPGKYIEHFDASQYGLGSGVYYFVLQAGNVVKTRKISLVR